MASTIVVRWTLLVFTLVMTGAGHSQQPEVLVTLKVPGDRSGAVISRDLFKQFAEQLGNGIEGGGCVGRNSSIPNVRGFCSDVVAALRAIRFPTCGRPSGCFAD